MPKYLSMSSLCKQSQTLLLMGIVWDRLFVIHKNMQCYIHCTVIFSRVSNFEYRAHNFKAMALQDRCRIYTLNYGYARLLH